MATIKIAQLTNQTAISDTDLVIVETATSTNKMTVGKFKELLGINSGGIVQSGSNANGSYIKFADGTLVCYRVLTSNSHVIYAYGAGFTTQSQPWTFPSAFLPGSKPVVLVSENGAAGNCWGGLGSGSTSSSATTFMLFCFVSKAYYPEVSLYAIGKWK